LNAEDLDLGSSGPVLLPDQPGNHPHVLVTAGKEGTIYVIDRNHMGKFHEPHGSHAVQTLLNAAGTGAFGAPAYWNRHLYFLASKDVLKDWAVEGGHLSEQPVAAASTVFTDPGATPTVSANGSKNGIVWVVQTKTWNARGSGISALLRAYDAANVAHELFNSTQNGWRDAAGPALRFVIPTVANGRVYVGAKNEVDVYALLAPPAPKRTPAPQKRTPR